MTQLLARAIFPNTDGVAADESVNQFAFDTTSTVAALATNVEAFYNTVHGGGVALGAFLSPLVSRVALASLIEIYDITGHLDGSPHGSPVATIPWTPIASLADPGLPDQLALTISFQADYGLLLEHGPAVARPTPHRAIVEGAPVTHLAKTRPRASRRGRIYVGPLNTGAIGTLATINTVLSDAGKAACVALKAAEPGWSVWSRTSAVLNPVVSGWVDTELGVIRRRKPKTAPRVVWP